MEVTLSSERTYFLVPLLGDRTNASPTLQLIIMSVWKPERERVPKGLSAMH